MKNIKGIVGFLEFRIGMVADEISDLILELERIAHSPNELGFTAGRITELNYELIKLKQYLGECKETEEDIFS